MEEVSLFNLTRLRRAIALLATFCLGALVGGKLVLESPNHGLGKVINVTLGQPADADFGLYWDVYNKIESRYPGKVDQKELLYGAIRGTVDSLGDPYSLFLAPEERNRFFEEIKGEFSGIGAEITQQGDQYVVVSPVAGSPAEAAGLKPQDIVLSVDGKAASDFGFNELINAIRGPKGTIVELKVKRGDEEKTFQVTRDTITVSSVDYTQRDDGLAYIRITQFGDDTVQRMTDAAKQVKDAKARGVVLDLRNNPGGYLDGAIDVASLFVKDGTIVKEQDKVGEEKSYVPTLESVLGDVPLVVLVNDGSASAAEIVAGAIQDHNRGKLVGVKTFGKGSVQEVEDLADGSALRLTVAAWLTPNGRAINKQGIEPDIQVNDDESTPADEQLDRAVGELAK